MVVYIYYWHCIICTVVENIFYRVSNICLYMLVVGTVYIVYAPSCIIDISIPRKTGHKMPKTYNTKQEIKIENPHDREMGYPDLSRVQYVILLELPDYLLYIIQNNTTVLHKYYYCISVVTTTLPV
ncbi:hypothetical protein GDO78_021348 [Eleutherodactylus coqui]|uniref:Uncharacterized protein n=1 Tax=Eleutherodactylus coqui TaxID=57060 RepID=A0A8J6B4E7_ELECQ|nr:hypothetical protein GDO78_021348 [Eleutherodactylus coqui]